MSTIKMDLHIISPFSSPFNSCAQMHIGSFNISINLIFRDVVNTDQWYLKIFVPFLFRIGHLLSFGYLWHFRDIQINSLKDYQLRILVIFLLLLIYEPIWLSHYISCVVNIHFDKNLGVQYIYFLWLIYSSVYHL